MRPKRCPFCGAYAIYRDKGPTMRQSQNLDKTLCKCGNRHCCAAKVYSPVDKWNQRVNVS